MDLPTRGARRRSVLALGLLPLVASTGRAQGAYPARPIQLVVAAPAGGPSDFVGRQVGDEMAKILGQPVVVLNKPGSGGVLAAEPVARAAPDGYTLMLSWIGNATGQALLANVPYDINRDFTHITQVMAGANVLAVHPSTGFKTLQELVRHAKANPGKLSYASAGNGSSGHLAMEMLKQRAGISMLHIPYRGGGPALLDLMAGQVQLMFNNQDAIMPVAATGKVVPLAITSSTRNAQMPNVPTVAESGYPGYEATAWAGISGPKGLPPAVVEALHAAVAKALQGPLRGKLEGTGAQVVGSTPVQFTAFVRRETDNWSAVIRQAGIRAD
jgi:tripartite-type tricarboxylate transporter receptor subunit TctC